MRARATRAPDGGRPSEKLSSWATWIEPSGKEARASSAGIDRAAIASGGQAPCDSEPIASSSTAETYSETHLEVISNLVSGNSLPFDKSARLAIIRTWANRQSALSRSRG